MDWTVEHIALAARNTLALKDWYVHTLGAVSIAQINPSPPAFLMRLPGGLLMEVYQSQSALDQTGDNGLAGWRHVALRVPDLTKARRHLEEKGVVFIDPVKPAGGGGQVLFFKDIEGNLLHLVERPKEWVL